MTLYLSACTVTVRPLLILKEIRTNNAMRINCTPPWHYVEEAAEVHVGCLEPSSDNYVYLHNQIHGSDISNAFITLLLFFTKSRNSLQNCSWPTLSHSLNSWAMWIFMDGSTNSCGEFGECCVHLSEMWELASELTCAKFATWHLLPAPNCQVYKWKVDVLVVYCPSLILLDTISVPTVAEQCG